MVLGEIFAGAGCATVTVTDAQPLNEVVVTETKPAAIAEVLAVSYAPSKPYNGLTHTFNYDYFDQYPVKPVAPSQTLDENLTGAYDPWKPYNTQMHSFNNDYFDQYLMKPVAGGYSAVVDEGERRIIRNVLDNLTTPKRFLNGLLQGKWGGAGRELSRFLINSTLGGLGMTDVAKYQFGIEKCDVDMGQTLEVWGWTESRYLLVPFLPPMTLRDAVGLVFDQVVNPVTYFFPIPFIGTLAKDTVAYVNNRGLRLETDQNLAEPLYGDSRTLYFIQRAQLINTR